MKKDGMYKRFGGTGREEDESMGGVLDAEHVYEV